MDKKSSYEKYTCTYMYIDVDIDTYMNTNKLKP